MKHILKHAALIALALLGFVLLTALWLRWYTNHGQSIALDNYVDMSITEAMEDAKKRSFTMVVLDSVFMVGQPGGQILNQNPKAGSKVKEDRTIYVTITKGETEQVPVRRLPILYGKDYERKRKELKQAFQIDTKVVDYAFDRGAPNHILEVRYEGQTIIDAKSRKDQVMVDKGGTLEVVLSKTTGGQLTMPDLTCKQYDEAAFQLQTLNLVIGESVMGDEIRDKGSSFIWRQEPSAARGVSMGDTITLFLSAQLPEGCQN
ncbi:MAG: PASTA domain-containing protein [Saprospiraceae bacterium]|nr:PASTA domain-containing protein [Saprospiraceae bacterium]